MWFVPLYNAKNISLCLDKKIIVCSWNDQFDLIKYGINDKPDSIALFDENLESNKNPLEYLFDNGFGILPLIFDQPCNYLEAHTIDGKKEMIHCGYYAIPAENARMLIKKECISSFLETTLYHYSDTKLFLNWYREIRFNIHTLQMAYLTYVVLLEMISNVYVEDTTSEKINKKTKKQIK